MRYSRLSAVRTNPVAMSKTPSIAALIPSASGRRCWSYDQDAAERDYAADDRNQVLVEDRLQPLVGRFEQAREGDARGRSSRNVTQMLRRLTRIVAPTTSNASPRCDNGSGDTI